MIESRKKHKKYLCLQKKREQIIRYLKLFQLLYVQSTCICNIYKMEYDKINNLLRSEELGESENLSKFVTR